MSGDHTALLLGDGRVLVIQEEPKIFDPAADAWTATGPPVQTRQAFAATLLADGRVLVTGGAGGAEAALRSAELFDPITNTWSPTGDMSVGRRFHTTTLLNDGRVLVVGGEAAGHGPYYGASDLYDPATGTFSATAAMEQGRAFHSATLLADGKVLVVGGEGDPHGYSLRDAATYDPRTGGWAVVPQLLTEGRVAHTATLLPDGTVIVAGGTILRIGGREENVRATTEIYRPDNQAWVAGPSLSKPRESYPAATVAGGRVLVFDKSEAEIYDPAVNRWIAAPAPGIGDIGSATLLRDRRILLLGDGQMSFYGVPSDAGGPATEAPESRSNGGFSWGVIAGPVLVVILGVVLLLFAVRRSRQPGKVAAGDAGLSDPS